MDIKTLGQHSLKEFIATCQKSGPGVHVSEQKQQKAI